MRKGSRPRLLIDYRTWNEASVSLPENFVVFSVRDNYYKLSRFGKIWIKFYNDFYEKFCFISKDDLVNMVIQFEQNYIHPHIIVLSNVSRFYVSFM